MRKKKIKIGETNTLNHNFNSFLEPRSVITLRIYPQTTTQAIRVRGGGEDQNTELKKRRPAKAPPSEE